jgi:hypothetical protein
MVPGLACVTIMSIGDILQPLHVLKLVRCRQSLFRIILTKHSPIDTTKYGTFESATDRQVRSIWNVSGATGDNSTNNPCRITIELPAPILNITVSRAYRFDNDTFSDIEIQNGVICTPGNSYEWGFSFYLLFITSILFWIWAIGMSTLGLNVHLNSRFD